MFQTSNHPIEKLENLVKKNSKISIRERWTSISENYYRNKSEFKTIAVGAGLVGVSAGFFLYLGYSVDITRDMHEASKMLDSLIKSTENGLKYHFTTSNTPQFYEHLHKLIELGTSSINTDEARTVLKDLPSYKPILESANLTPENLQTLTQYNSKISHLGAPFKEFAAGAAGVFSGFVGTVLGLTEGTSISWRSTNRDKIDSKKQLKDFKKKYSSTLANHPYATEIVDILENCSHKSSSNELIHSATTLLKIINSSDQLMLEYILNNINTCDETLSLLSSWGDIKKYDNKQGVSQSKNKKLWQNTFLEMLNDDWEHQTAENILTNIRINLDSDNAEFLLKKYHAYKPDPDFTDAIAEFLITSKKSLSEKYQRKIAGYLLNAKDIRTADNIANWNPHTITYFSDTNTLIKKNGMHKFINIVSTTNKLLNQYDLKFRRLIEKQNLNIMDSAAKFDILDSIIQVYNDNEEVFDYWINHSSTNRKKLQLVKKIVEAGFSPETTLPDLLEQHHENQDAEIERWKNILALVKTGKIDKEDALHLNIGYAEFLNFAKSTGLHKRHAEFSEYKRVLFEESIEKNKKKLISHIDDITFDKEIDFLCIEANHVFNAINTIVANASKESRQVVIVPNITYGLTAVSPIKELLASAGLPIIPAKIGSSESHNNSLILKPDLFTKNIAEDIFKNQPIYVIIDGTRNVGGKYASSNKYPDSAQGYLNYVLLLNDILTKESNDHLELLGVSKKHAQELRETSEYDNGFEDFSELYRSKTQDEKRIIPYSMNYWNPADLSLHLFNAGKNCRDKVESAKLQTLTGPSFIFINSTMPKSKFKKINPEYETHDPAFFDDKLEAIITYSSTGFGLSVCIEEEAKKLYCEKYLQPNQTTK